MPRGISKCLILYLLVSMNVTVPFSWASWLVVNCSDQFYPKMMQHDMLCHCERSFLALVKLHYFLLILLLCKCH